MSSAPRSSTARATDAAGSRGAELAYNIALALFGGVAVILFILGGASSDLQVLWVIALHALLAIVLLFTAHRFLTRENS